MRGCFGLGDEKGMSMYDLIENELQLNGRHFAYVDAGADLSTKEGREKLSASALALSNLVRAGNACASLGDDPAAVIAEMIGALEYIGEADDTDGPDRVHPWCMRARAVLAKVGRG